MYKFLKQSILLAIAVGLVSVVLTSCKKDEEKNTPQWYSFTTRIDGGAVTKNSASCVVNLVAEYGSEDIYNIRHCLGVRWEADRFPDGSSRSISGNYGYGSNLCTLQLTNLKPNTTYYVQSYVKFDGYETYYGNLATFTTLSDTGLPDEINQFITPELLQEIEGLGMPIYRGNNPPANIVGQYLVAPDVCVATNVPNDPFGPGHKFSDLYLTLSNQKQSTITVAVSQGSGTGDGHGAYIIGEGNKFTIFVPMDYVYNGHSYKTVDIYSGIAAINGIKDCYHSTFMISGGGKQWGLIEDGQGRVFYDKDGFSEKTSLKSARITDNKIAGSSICEIKW